MSIGNSNLTHLISGTDNEEAYQKFFNIIYERQLNGSGRLIKSSHNCICFTEQNIIEKFPFEKTRYRKFGITFNKHLIYELGAEKVIYCREEDYYKLPQCMQWRYQLHSPPLIDFSWENEVRINKNYINLEEAHFELLVPDATWADRLYEDYYSLEWNRYDYECMGYGEEYATYPDDIDFSIFFINS